MACALMAGFNTTQATEIEPRAFSNTPVGLNFLIAGYVYTEGSVSFDPAVPLTDAQLRTNNTVLAYARSLNAWGRSAKFDVILPHTWLEGSAQFAGQPRTREVYGLADPRLRVSVNFIGAPALSVPQFKAYRQDLIVGASLQVMPPLGQYDDSRLVNIGTNRWAIKSELGISKAWDAWTLEIIPGVIYYTDNTDFLNGGTLEQAPLYTLQGHLIIARRVGRFLERQGLLERDAENSYMAQLLVHSITYRIVVGSQGKTAAGRTRQALI